MRVLSNLYGPNAHILPVTRASASGVGVIMRIPGPFSDESWDLFPPAAKVEAERPARAERNSFGRVVWELGLVVAVPLMGAAVVEFALRALAVY
jgi:hypothetical protein